ncbi:ParB-like protein [Prochlorococcus marinus]|nr:ParB-like protein [Prochlorococcus marinus]
MFKKFQFTRSEYKQISTPSSESDLFKVQVKTLLPTQMCIGLAEVINRKKDFLIDNKREILEYLKTKPVPLVSNGNGNFWMLDRHHRLRALLEADEHAEAYGYIVTEVKTNQVSHMLDFLDEQGWLYLYNSRGLGPHPTKYLKENLLELEDDPYRSLVWKLKQEGIIKAKPLIPYHEFRWAAWLRKRPLPPFNSRNLTPALTKARKFTTSQAASSLAGWTGDKI